MSCNEWKNVKIDDICDIRRGASPRPIIKYVSEKGIHWVKIADATSANSRYISNTKEYICEEGKDKSVFVQEGDLILSNSATPGIPKFMGIDACIHDGWLLLNNFKKCNKMFLYYKLVNDRDKLLCNANGSVFKNLKTDIVKNHIIKLPPLEEQEKIANILSSLDDKIELNNEMNKTLEEMAQSLFKRWFVDFEFPSEDGKSYKSSGGEMVDSELGMIPKGWEVKSIYDSAEYINGTSFKAKDYSVKGLPIIKIAELKNGITDGTKFFSGEKDEKFYIKNGDILFSWSGNPDTSIDTFIWDKGEAILNQHIFKVIPKFDKGYAFTYLMLKYLKSTFTHIARNKQTTGLGHVTVKDLKELKIALCFSKINEFNEVVEPMVDLIFENNMSIEQLNKIRDSLLPKLMSGEIRVK